MRDIEKAVFTGRMQKVQAQMEQNGISCFLVGPGSTMRYLTGYPVKADERLLALVLIPGQRPLIVANVLYELQARETAVEEFVLWSDGEDAIALLLSTLRARGVENGAAVAVEKTLPGLFLVPLFAQLPGARFSLGDSLTDGLRLYKDATEMACMEKACRLAADALQDTISRGSWWIGHTETEFMAMLSAEMTKRGLESPTGIVAVGANAAQPHHIPDETKIERGNCLLVDFGGGCEGYRSDMTRTFYFGEPTEEFRRVYQIVLEALYHGHEAAKIGNQLQDVDRAARSYITEQGYGAYFTHRTGHGIGLDGHEGPSAAEGSLTEIQPGMAFSIEPGIYLAGKFGVRIEDQALIGPEGLRILHDFPRELLIFN